MSKIKVDKKGRDWTKQELEAYEKSIGMNGGLYDKIAQIVFDDDVDIYVYCPDKFLRKAFSEYLDSLGFKKNEHVEVTDENWSYLYVCLDRYNYNCKTEGLKDASPESYRAFPSDWDYVKSTVEDYLLRNPIPEVEAVVKNTESWNNPMDWDDIEEPKTIDDVTMSIDDALSVDTKVPTQYKNNVFELSTPSKGYHILCKNGTHAKKILVAMGYAENESDVKVGTDLNYYYYDGETFDPQALEILNGDVYGELNTSVPRTGDIFNVLALGEKLVLSLTECKTTFTDEEIKEEVILPKTNPLPTYDGDDEEDEEDEDILEGLATQEEIDEEFGCVVKDWIFAYTDEGGDVSYAITPNEFYIQNGYLYDQHIHDIYVRMPNEKFGELMESIFEYNGLNVDAIKDLVLGGFKFNPDFQIFMDSSATINGTPIIDYIKANYPNAIV